MFNIGTLPVNFNLSSGTITWSGTTATNDTGGTFSVQNRVFSGFCRDVDGTARVAGSDAGDRPALLGERHGDRRALRRARSRAASSAPTAPSAGRRREPHDHRHRQRDECILSGSGSATLVSIFSIRRPSTRPWTRPATSPAPVPSPCRHRRRSARTAGTCP
jgi:hypothetical protein